MLSTLPAQIPEPGTAIFSGSFGNRTYTRPVEVVQATTVREVVPALKRIESAVGRGFHAAGFLAYEAAPAFDAAFRVHEAGPLPLLHFGIYSNCSELAPAPGGDWGCGPWRSTVDRPAYEAAIERIRAHIAAGDTYQVNYTFPMEADFEGDALSWFRSLCSAQGGGYPAYLDTGRFAILSASPELFFALEDGRVTCRPMKGTRPRGRWAAEDRAQAAALAVSEKDQAENIMIVDMVRNDLGRIAQPGKVVVEDRFTVERYETVWQMTSTVTAQARVPVPDILAALFPCASVTGAPKVETMKIIHSLETAPRGVYCGAVGWWGPDGRACFNVPIRTVTVDRVSGTARYGVGSGVTWDSTAASEYQECLDKAALLAYRRQEFDLLETMLWERDGYFLLAMHLDRLEESAAYFGFECDRARIEASLSAHAQDFGASPRAVRLLLARDGTPRIEARPAPPPRNSPMRVAFAAEPVNPDEVLLHHKTTARTLYESARASRPDCDDVLLWNVRGEVTESTIANVVVRTKGGLLTPPRESGLLGGVFREYLLDSGEISEAPLAKDDVRRAESLYLINSVRRWIPAVLVE